MKTTKIWQGLCFAVLSSLLGAACISTDTGEPGPDPTPNACWPNDVDYSTCSGSTFFPDGSCAQGSCAADDISMKVFAEWAAQAQDLSGLDETTFWNRVQVSTVEVSGSFIRIEVVYVMDWMRAREAFGISTSGFSPVPTPEEITKAVSLVIRPSMWEAFGNISSLASVATLRNAVSTCQCGADVDWCHMRFQNDPSNRLFAPGLAVINEAANQCKQVDVDTVTAEVISCTDVPCGVN